MNKRNLAFLVALPMGVFACSSGEPQPVAGTKGVGAGAAVSGAETPAAAAPPAVSMPAPVGAASCESPSVEDFEGGDNKTEAVGRRGGNWFTYKDDAGSTVLPEGVFAPAAGGANGSKSAAHIGGKTAGTQDVYVGIGSSLADPIGPYDLSKAKGLCFFAKGKGRARVTLPDVNTFPQGGICKSCYNDFGADFALTADWKEHCFEFAKLQQRSGWGERKPALARERVYAMQWSVTNPGTEYDLWLDDVRLTCD